MLDWHGMKGRKNLMPRMPAARGVLVGLMAAALLSACGDRSPATAPVPSPTAVSPPPVVSGTASAGVSTSANASRGPEGSAGPGPAAKPRAITPTSTPPRPNPTATPDRAAPRPGQKLPASDRDLYDLAMRLRPDDEIPASRIVSASSGPMEVGHQDEFFVTNLFNAKSRRATATVRVVSEHAYWYVEDGLDIPQADLEVSARIFEEQIHPVVVGVFGDIWNPGVDGDPRLTILHAQLSGAAGYFGAKDEFPRQVHPTSNEREIIYMDTRTLEPATDLYLGVLAHEFQHAVHWNQDPGEESWVNEGMAELAAKLAGYPTHAPERFLAHPQTQLNWWPDELRSTAPHYGASMLFFTYLAAHYGGLEGLGRLIGGELDGVAGLNAYLSGHETSFTEVFQDWVVANYLDAPFGRYGYPATDVSIRAVVETAVGRPLSKTQPQFSARYFRVPEVAGTVTVSFRAATTTRQLKEGCHGGTRCWWSGMGDSMDSTLTRRFDLSGLTEATLEFDLYYDIERGWDYGYVVASRDGGKTWGILQSLHATDYNPSGNAYGRGYTGASRGWVDETVDLTPYAGGEVLIRFEYVTDDAAHLDGFALDNIAIPETGFVDDAESPAGWDARGFTRTDGMLPQEFAVQLVSTFPDGSFEVTRMDLDENNVGELAVDGVGSEGKGTALIVSPVTDGTRHAASFELSFDGP